MKQYWDIKSLHQDKILLFRMGDFFEMFHDDAQVAAPLLGIALTQRNKKSNDETPMCGMPHHSIAGPINRLLAHGHKVAICDQIEDPKLAKGIVKRAVTRVLTPGMVYDSDNLDDTKAHYLASVDSQSISFLDTTTGEAFYFRSQNLKELLRLLAILPVAELVISREHEGLINETKNKTLSFHEEILTHHLLGTDAPSSAGRLLSYVVHLWGEDSLKTFSPFQSKSFEHRLDLSATVVRHLEIFQTYQGAIQGSLYHAIARTQTSAGSRLLRNWIQFPLRDRVIIEKRLDQIDFWRGHLLELKKIREILSHMGDIERRLGKMAQPQCNGRDLLALAQSIHSGVAAWELVKSFGFEKYATESFVQLAQQIEQTIVEEPPLSTKQGYMIRKGVSSEIDELIELSTNSQKLIAQMELQERERTGISSLKIRYNNVFGYYIEITNTHKDKVPSDYQRKQTLSNAERFCTQELIELEQKVITAQSRRNDVEFECFENLRKSILMQSMSLLQLAQKCSEWDVITSLAWLSLEEKYCRPQFVNESQLFIQSSRHPVGEQLSSSNFIANTIDLSQKNCLLLTGPNMAGKSTLMRQVALSAILAQMGSYVPATEARLPIFDAIYTRIGASDQLSEGLSTFMVEMTETAQMLKEATAQSLVILDEVGRGTSTFDGMCLAKSILEYIIQSIQSVTLFATHYHELTEMDQEFQCIQNAHMSVVDRGGQIRFLHTLVNGPALKSYGIQVAELAGVPAMVTKKAKLFLQQMEKKQGQLSLLDYTYFKKEEVPAETLNPQTKAMHSIIAEVKSLSLNQLTPLQAMNRIAQWQQNIDEFN